MITALFCLYAFIGGLYAGEWLTERKHKKAIDCQAAIRASFESVTSAKKFVGRDCDLTNHSEWSWGERRFHMIVRPLDSKINLR